MNTISRRPGAFVDARTSRSLPLSHAVRFLSANPVFKLSHSARTRVKARLASAGSLRTPIEGAGRRTAHPTLFANATNGAESDACSAGTSDWRQSASRKNGPGGRRQERARGTMMWPKLLMLLANCASVPPDSRTLPDAPPARNAHASKIGLDRRDEKSLDE